jgi:hypothetical protein
MGHPEDQRLRHPKNQNRLKGRPTGPTVQNRSKAGPPAQLFFMISTS